MGIISGCRSTMWNPRPARRCYVRGRGRPELLYALVKIRAAQLNGCAYCLDTRNRDARAGGEDQRRLDVLSAWREAPDQFSRQERTALALTESVTRIGEGGDSGECTTVPQSILVTRAWCRAQAVATINVWNRLAVSSYQDMPDMT